MKNGMFYTQLQSIYSNLTDEKLNENKKTVFDHIDILIRLNQIAKKQGLLALEDETARLRDEHLQKIMMFVVDGIFPDEIEEIAWNRFIVANPDMINQLLYLMSLEAALSFQSGDSTYVYKEKIFSLIPENLTREYLSICEDQRPIDQSKVESLCEGELGLQPGDKGYYTLSLLDAILIDLDDHSMQRILRDIDYADLELAFKILSGDSKKNIIDNMSKKAQLMIADDIENMGPIPFKTVQEAIDKVFMVIMNLADKEEIVIAQNDAAKGLYQLFKENEADEVPEQVCNLRKLLNDFEFHNSRLI